MRKTVMQPPGFHSHNPGNAKFLLAGLRTRQWAASPPTMELPFTDSRVSLDWDYVAPVLQKLRKATVELETAGPSDESVDQMSELLRALVNLTRHIGT